MDELKAGSQLECTECGVQRLAFILCEVKMGKYWKWKILKKIIMDQSEYFGFFSKNSFQNFGNVKVFIKIFSQEKWYWILKNIKQNEKYTYTCQDLSQGSNRDADLIQFLVILPCWSDSERLYDFLRSNCPMHSVFLVTFMAKNFFKTLLRALEF